MTELAPIQKIIVDAIKEINEEICKPALSNPGKTTRLYGEKGNLDSLALVALLSSIETKVYKKFKKNITIASDKAMSWKKSPFKDVASLADYLFKLLEEK